MPLPEKIRPPTGLSRPINQLSGKRPTTLGLGDGPNDAPLLEVMDYAVIVKGLNREGVHLHDEDPTRVWRTQREGPEGWREGLDHFFSAR
ncbi:mannosyl-3-phosphoglycerate phosphatase [Escherichia coli]|uniref:Mannosyl-3-phosphoglycerate phosphatase n=1 Tax=Escherichia coli TaxID=562 RepID=A0A2X3LZX2_ECOLX|nr:mannosyl-3-phosphoglycerate phosphatase [Escherichia coli]